MNPNQILWKSMIEDYLDAYGKFDIDAMMEHLDANFVFQNVTHGTTDLETHGLDAFRKQAEQAQSLFRERKQTIKAWDFRDDRIILDIEFEGVLNMDLPNGLNAGDVLALTGQSEFVFDGDKITLIRDSS